MPSLDDLLQQHRDELQSKRYEERFWSWLRSPGLGATEGLIRAEGLPQATRRALGIANDAAGGFLAPESLAREVRNGMSAASTMRRLARVVEAPGSEFGIVFVERSGSGRILPEGTAASESDLVVGMRRLPAFMFSPDILRASFQLMQDVGPAIQEVLIRELAEATAALLNQVATTGSGAGQPQGIMTGCQVGVTGAAGQTSTVSFADLNSLVASVDSRYTFGPSGLSNLAHFMLNGASFAAIKSLLDASGSPLWEPDRTGLTPGFLCGFPVAVNLDMPDLGAGNRPVAFGNFKRAYTIADGVTITSILVEAYAERGQVGFHIASRHAAGLDDLSAVKCFQNAAA